MADDDERRSVGDELELRISLVEAQFAHVLDELSRLRAMLAESIPE